MNCSSRRADRGTLGVYCLRDGHTARLTAEKCCVQGFDAAGKKLLLVKGAPRHIADLFLLGPGNRGRSAS